MGHPDATKTSSRYTGTYRQQGFKGQKRQCVRCDFYRYEDNDTGTKRIYKTKKGWLCERCIDPQDG